MLKKFRKHLLAKTVIPIFGVMMVNVCLADISFAQDAPVEETLPANVADAETLSDESAAVKDTALDNILNDISAPSDNGGQVDEQSAPFEFNNQVSVNDPEVQDLVLAVFVGRQNLSSGIFAIEKNGQFYLPFSTLSNILGFNGDVDPVNRTAEGWVNSKEDNYYIDAKNMVLRYRGEKFDLPSDSVLGESAADDDIYVLSEVLTQIWPTQIDVNLNSLILKFTPDTKFPYQIAEERRLARDKTLASLEYKKDEKDFPFVPYPYQAFTKPAVDLSASAGYAAGSNDLFAGTSINGVNDLGYFSADYGATINRVGSETDQPDNIRFRLRRQNVYDGALPYNLEDVQLGDVRLQNRELISNGSSGRGFIFSNQKNDLSGQFDVVTVDGFATPGWEVELYLNNQLIEFATVDERGEYRFEDVSVDYGNNRFRVVLYGPQGQIIERVENYLFQSNMLRRGENVISGGFVDENSYLFPVDPTIGARAEGLAANVYAARGLFRNLTGFVTANTIHDRVGKDNISRDYLSAGAIASVGSTLAQLEGYKQLDGGQAVDVRTLSDFLGFRINTQVSAYSDFESPDANSGAFAKKYETELGVKRVFRTLVGALGLELRHRYNENQSGATTQRYFTRQTLGFGAWRLTNVTNTGLSNGDHQTSSGDFNTSIRQNRWNFRNGVSYNIHPDAELTSFNSEIRYRQNRDYSMAVNASYNFINDTKRIGYQISRDFKNFLGSAQTEWTSNGGLGFSLRASTSLGPYGENDEYIARSTPMTGTGAVNSFVYNDVNYNGEFDGEDTPIENAKVILNRRNTREDTNEAGHVLDFTNPARINAKVASSTIDDPYLVSSVAGYNIHPRPGVLHKLNFPMIETGAIDGTLRWSEGGEPIAGVTLQLLDEEADVIQTTKTGVDGYYTFEKIAPGNYTIRPDPADGLDIPFQYVSLQPDDMFQFGMDVVGNAEVAEQVDLGKTDFANDGTLNVKDIMSIAKGYKEKQRLNKNIHQASLSNMASNSAQPMGGGASKPNIKNIRVGEHPDKVRIVMDLSGPVNYSINYDDQNSTVYVELPYASISGDKNWVSKGQNILNGYRVDTMDDGVKLIIDVKQGVNIGGSGLLKADAGKNDRLFIDIEKK